MLMRVSALICLSSLSVACATEVIVEKPVPVEVEVIKWTPVPADLTRQEPKKAIPDALSYGQAIELWSKDRASLDIVNARLSAVEGLSDETIE